MVGGPRVNIPQRPGEARETLADNTKLQTLLKLKPKAGLKEYIKKMMS